MRKLFSLLTVLAVSIPMWAGGESVKDSLLVARGDSCMAQYDYFHAMQYYEQVNEADCALTSKLATCHFLRANYRRCVNLLKTLPADSLDHDALRQLFYSHKALENRALQQWWGERLLNRFPMDSEVVADMGLACNLNDNPEKALALTERYEAIDATNTLVKRQRADAQFFLKRYSEAAQTYEQLLQLGDTTFSAHYSLGMCYEQLAETEDNHTDSLLLRTAAEHYGRAVALNDSAKAWALYHLGAVLVKLHRNSEGIHVLLMALQRMQPDDAAMFNLHSALADGYYQNEEYYSAIYDWKNCLKYNPQSLASMYNIAQTYELIEEDGVKAEQAYMEFLRWAENVKDPPVALQEWMAHAEAFGSVRQRMEEKRAAEARFEEEMRLLREKRERSEK